MKRDNTHYSFAYSVDILPKRVICGAGDCAIVLMNFISGLEEGCQCCW